MSSIIGKSQRQSRFFVSLLSIGINVLALALPLALLQVYDRILPNQAIGSAFVIFTAVVVALCFSGVLRYVRSGVFARWSAEQEHQLWSETATNLTRGLHSKEEAFLLTGAPTKARDLNVGQTMLARYDAPFSVVFLALIAYLGGVVVAAPLLVAIFALVVFLMVVSKNRSALERELHTSAQFQESMSVLANAPLNATTVSSLGSAFSRLVFARAGLADAIRTTQGVSSLQMDLLQSGALISTVGVVWLGAGEVLAGEMTTGGLAACTLLGSRAASQLMGVAALALRRQPSRVAARQSQTVLNAHEIEFARAQEIGAISDFPAGGGIWILESSEHQTATEKLSALVNKLPFLMDETGKMRVVPARPRLLSGTLMDNLSRLDSDLEPEARAASVELGLDDLVARLPHGYDTEVAASGSPLAEGGTKRAAIVQAFVGDPELVVLEAPEASLDVGAIDQLSEFLLARSERVKVILQTSSEKLRDGLEGTGRLQNPRTWIEGVE